MPYSGFQGNWVNQKTGANMVSAFSFVEGTSYFHFLSFFPFPLFELFFFLANLTSFSPFLHFPPDGVLILLVRP
jgi:hypothetical protein